LSSKIDQKVVRANINYKLSSSQKKIAKEIFLEKKEIYVKAVCGAGKTECVFPSIEKSLQEGKRVGFAIPRKEVVKEIYERLKEVFPTVSIVAVYGGHNKELKGDIIVFTVHQSFRFKKAFGLLIVDEYDAFPFKGNDTLFNFLKETCVGKKIYLSATFLKEELEGKRTVYLDKRYHYINIPVPEVKIVPRFFQYFVAFKECKRNKEVLFVFVPTILESIKFHKFLSKLNVKSILFNSKVNNKQELFNLIKRKTYKVIITTSILERGITLEGLNVLIINANHTVFDHRCLIQISGRVGRKKNHPTGKILLLTNKMNNEIKKAIQDIQKSNSLINHDDLYNL